MVTAEDLGDAAIALARALDELRIPGGIFGGVGVGVLGGPRESKDIDCLVHCRKDWLVTKLSQKADFKSMGNKRPDIATFLWGPCNILVECFPSERGLEEPPIPISY